jgi:chromosomal replication initiation ATPase DnaA
VTVDLNPRCTFASFVEGPENQMAAAAARSVASALGIRYNPLCVVGSSGLGKTHLLMATGHEAIDLQPDASVLYCSADEFAKEYHAAVAAGESQSFRTRYESLDLLLLDDAQALAYQPEVQVELLRLFTRLIENGRQVALTCDLAPAEFDTLDPQLAERVAGGLVVDVALPEPPTRLAILERRATDRSTVFTDGVLEEAARLECRNVRELLALLHRLAAVQSMQGTPLSLADARAIVFSDTMDPPVAQTAPLPVPEPAAPDEFSSFLEDVSHTLEEQVDHWREAVARAVMRWEPEGYRTARLEQALAGNFTGPVERIVSRYDADVRRLQRLQDAVGEVDPDRANDPVFFDPDRTADAEALLKEVLANERPLPVPADAWGPGSFAETECSRAASSALASVVAEPGQRYNPLVITGPPGVGKSHLLHLAGHQLADQGLATACMSAQFFADQFAEAQAAESEDRFRAWLGRASALLVDDVQILVERQDAAGELAYLMDRCLQQQRQMVFAVSAEPGDIDGLDARIVSRLEGGLIVAIDPPDRALRRHLTIARIEAHYGAAELELVEYLEARPAASARAVIGVAQRILNGAEARGDPPSAEMARDLLEGVRPQPRRSARIRVTGSGAAPTAATSREKAVWHWPDLAARIIDEEIG